jgi:hypothetical protein
LNYHQFHKSLDSHPLDNDNNLRIHLSVLLY